MVVICLGYIYCTAFYEEDSLSLHLHVLDPSSACRSECWA